jgi:hypothetical protein
VKGGRTTATAAERLLLDVLGDAARRIDRGEERPGDREFVRLLLIEFEAHDRIARTEFPGQLVLPMGAEA